MDGEMTRVLVQVLMSLCGGGILRLLTNFPSPPSSFSLLYQSDVNGCLVSGQKRPHSDISESATKDASTLNKEKGRANFTIGDFEFTSFVRFFFFPWV